MMTYTYDPELNIFHLHATGILIVDDPISYFHNIAKDTLIMRCAIERGYFQKLKNIAFTYVDIQKIRSTINELRHFDRLLYSVFVTDSDYTFGMARMIISIIDHPSHDFKIERVD